MSQEFFPSYPTLAFASRRDHELWLEQQAAQPAVQEPVVYLTKEVLQGLKLTGNETNSVYEMLFPEGDKSLRGGAKLAEIWRHANISQDTYQDYLAAVQTIRG